MKRSVSETFGLNFRTDLIRTARNKTLEAVLKVAKRVKPGMNTLDMKDYLKEELLESESSSNWT